VALLKVRVKPEIDVSVRILSEFRSRVKPIDFDGIDLKTLFERILS